MKFVFWNVGRKEVESTIVQLASETQPDFLVLAEYQGVAIELLRRLDSYCPGLHLIPAIACDRITLFSTFSPNSIHHRRETSRFTIKELRYPGGEPLLIGMVHLQSKLHYSDDDQLYSAMFLRNEIEKSESEAGHRNTLILGDFNMNPFDRGMLYAGAMNAINCLETASREIRVVQGQAQKLFYNPSWNLLGDFDDNPGTYFHQSPSTLSLFWNTLDQVILRPSLARTLDRSSLRIIRSLTNQSLVSPSGIPSVSDHLPITFTIETSS